MKPLIKPVERNLIEEELTKDKFIRITNNLSNEIYIINSHNSPNTMLELGRIRELTFRDAGGGTGQEVDIDKYDTDEVPFEQLIVWNPEDKEIIGGYRFILGNKIPFDDNNMPISPTSHLFKYSETFIKDYLPYTIELGRSFVQPEYQPSKNFRKGIYALDNIWDGLGAITVENPSMKYFFGKMTMYNSFNRNARDMILFVLKKHFGDKNNLLTPYHQQNINLSIEQLNQIFVFDNYDEDYKVLVKQVRSYNENIPPLINIYMGLTAKMLCFGTSSNIDFGEVEESAIMIAIDDIKLDKKIRHIMSYNKNNGN